MGKKRVNNPHLKVGACKSGKKGEIASINNLHLKEGA